MKAELQEERRAYIRLIQARTGLSPTEIARESLLTPSTLTRFMNRKVDHTLSDVSLTKIRSRFGDDPQPTSSVSRDSRLKGGAPSVKARLHGIIRDLDEPQALKALAVFEAIFLEQPSAA